MNPSPLAPVMYTSLRCTRVAPPHDHKRVLADDPLSIGVIIQGDDVRKTGPNGRALIERNEGLRLEAYRDVRGIPTIGYGHTRDVHMGDSITVNQAESFLADDLADAEHCVSRNAPESITQNQFDALVSFVFNLGCARFAGSTLLLKLRAGDIEGAADEFRNWTRAGTQHPPGLIRRRDEERQLFLTPDA